MPIHEYACRACGHEFETLVRCSEIPSCAKCSSEDLVKKLSVFATQAAKPAAPAGAGPCGGCAGGPGSCRFN